MSEKLILRISSQPAKEIPWLVLSTNTNEVIASGELANQSELINLADYARGRQVTVIVNNADVRLHRHNLATKPTRQMLKALPFMLEDELAEDIDALHFAMGESGYDKTTEQHWINLAIVNKQLVETWLAALSDAGISVKRLLPEVLCLPQNQVEGETALSMIQLADGWLVRQDEWKGEFVESDWLPLMVQQWQMKTAGDEASTLHVKYYSALPEEISAQLIAMENVSLDAAEPELAMLLLAKGSEQVTWNLLQGDLAPKKAVSKHWLVWRTAAVLLIATLILEFGSKGAAYMAAEQELEAAKAELVEQYQAAFPKEKVRVALLRRQLNRKVAEATGGAVTTDSGFLSLMAKISPVLADNRQFKSDSYRFDGKRGELRISANAPSFQQFEQFKNGLEQLGLEVKLGAVNNEGTTVSGSLSVKEAS